MNREIAKLMGEITALGILISTNENSNKVVFIRYSGHVDKIDVSVCDKVNFKNELLSLDMWFDLGTEDCAISKLKKTKHELIKIARNDKINFSKFPYSVEEVKHYKLA